MHQFLIHQRGDHVGVAVRDVGAGERAVAVYLDDDSTVEVDVTEAVPLGHKVAVVDVEPGAPVVKYGIPIGRTPQGFRRGQYVHTHNLRSARW
jgi:(2R)-sulfolactate sulfo-lyase subunit alpha